VKEAAGRGERSVIYLFEETERTFVRRCRPVNIPVDRMQERGTLRIEEVDATDLSTQEFADRVRRAVHDDVARIVIIDGLAGYNPTLQGELRKAIGVLKKRTSDYERTLRQFRITSQGITVGDPLTRLRGVLSGTPELASPDDRDEQAD
jgi:circadian clock protein KaiC